MIEVKKLEQFNDNRGLLLWSNPTIIGFDYKYLTIGTINKGCSRGGHYHKRTFEKLLCISGKLRFRLDFIHYFEDVIIFPGELVTIPLKSIHTIFNDSDELATFVEFKSEEFNKDDSDTYTK